MEITKTSPPLLGANAHNYKVPGGTGNSINTTGDHAVSNLNVLTTNLTGSINQYLNTSSDTPLTTQTLDNLMKVFWSNALQTQVFFCADLWNACEKIVSNLTQDAQKISRANNTLSRGLRKSPIVFSTREGLVIALNLKSKGDSFEVDSVFANPGGCSIDVARALNNFGTPFKLIGIRGIGPISDNFNLLLDKEGIDPSCLTEVHGDIRFFMCFLANKKEHWVVSSSQCLMSQELDSLTNQLMDACKSNRGQVLALANNPPLGGKNNYMPDIIKETKNKSSMFVIYDTKLHAVGKDLLNAVLESAPGMMKPNLAEYAEIVGIEEEKLRSDKNLIVHLAQDIIKKYGIKIILVSMDKDGAMLIDNRRAAIASTPPIEVVSTIGAGDTGIAAMIDKSKERKMSFKKPSDSHFKEFLKAFVAAGSATAKKPGTELATLEEVQDMEKDVSVKFV